MTDVDKRTEKLSTAKRELLRKALAASLTEDGPEPRPRPDSPAPLTRAQERMWFLNWMDPDNAAYNVPHPLRVRGRLDVAALSAALDALQARHEPLRTTVTAVDGVPFQIVHPPSHVPLAVRDLVGRSSADLDAEVRMAVEGDSNEPFDLVAGPLWRVSLLRLSDDDHVLLLCFHHIITDGWSMRVLLRDLGRLYNAARAGAPDPLPPLEIQYADFAIWEHERNDREAEQKTLAFWRENLVGAPVILELPTDRPRPPLGAAHGRTLRLSLPQSLVERLQEIARGENATLFGVLSAAARLLLARHSAQNEVLLGTPVFGRPHPKLEGLVGLFVNTVPVRAAVDGDPSFTFLLTVEQQALVAAVEHGSLPFERLVEELQPERSLARNPVFQVVVTLQQEIPELELPGCTVSPIVPELQTTKFDLSFNHAVEPGGGLRLSLQWAVDLWEEPTIERLALRYRRILERIAADPELPRSRLVEPSGEEWRFEVLACNRTDQPYPRGSTVHRLFEEQAALSPGAVAIDAGEVVLTYAELNARANRLARRLRAAGVRPESRVGVVLGRSPELIVTLLAIMKAGGAYVPVDLAFPAERLHLIEADAGMSVIVADEGVRHETECPVISLSREEEAIAAEPDTNLPLEIAPASLLYILYTSGSTGRPKGVGIPHRAVCRLVRGQSFARVGADEVFLLTASPVFDASSFEIWAPLLNGGRVAIGGGYRPTIEEIDELIRLRGVTSMWLSAALFHVLVEESPATLGRLRQLIVGGEPLNPSRTAGALEAHSHLRLINGYGPTENTTFSCCHAVRPEDAAGVSIPIGLPIANTRAYVLDNAMQPCPAGIPGELYVGGDGLARGYVGLPGLTAERFVPDPFSRSPGGRLYRTGDRVRRRLDGDLEFLGRLDFQVKIRGFRIEPGEIEAALLSHPQVREGLVVAREDEPGDRRLVAYVVAEGDLTAESLRSSLAERLPQHMIPSAFVRIDALPLTPSGKVDRRALPAPEAASLRDYIAPRTPTEEVLAALMETILGVRQVGIDDDFFALGGHSLRAVQLVSRIREAFSVEMSLREIFQDATVRSLAVRVDAQQGEREDPEALVPFPRDRPLPLSFAQERLWFSEQLARGLYNMPFRYRVDGPLDREALRRALETIVARHESLRARYRMEDGSVMQEIAPPARFELPVLRFGDEEEAAAWLDEEAWRPFDLEHGPFARAALLRLPADAHVLALNVHHSAADGWSWTILLRELSALYAAFRNGRRPRVDPAPLQYPDYAVWQRKWLSGRRLEAQLAYWRDRLSGVPPVLELPTDRPRPARLTRRGGLHMFEAPPAAREHLASLGRQMGATTYMVLTAAFQVLLARWSGQRDFAVGTPVAGRRSAATEDIVGMFVNMLPVRARLAGNPTFRELVARVRETTLGAYENQDIPFERLVSELRVERSLSHEPIFQVVLSLNTILPEPLPLLEGARCRQLEVRLRNAKYDLALEAFDLPEGLGLAFEYNAELFDAATIERLAGRFQRILAAVTADPDVRPLEADFLDAAERALLMQWGTGEAPPEARLTSVPAAFEARAAESPEACAIRFAGRTTTYAELNARANAIAFQLRELGCGIETRVAVCLERTPDTIAAILGVLKCGAVYVPLDPGYPAVRTAALLDDAWPAVIVTTSSLSSRLPPDAPLLLLDQLGPMEAPGNPNIEIPPGSLIYVLYTSGSTGRPKGVMVEHGSVAALVAWLDDVLPAREREAVLASTPFTFDVSVAEVLGTLCLGGSLVLVETALDAARLPESEAVRLGVMPPTAAAELVRSGGFPATLEALNLGGEHLSHALARELHASGTLRVRNLYGPTECTVYATCAEIGPEDPRPPIGRPISGTNAYVLDRELRLVPVGTPGELYLGGAGVARGYEGRAKRTAAGFLPDPLSGAPGARMYRTGDRVRWRADGQLEYLERVDTQVKLRGFRIELGEVENALVRLPTVAGAVVALRDDEPGDTRLVAYVVSRPAEGGIDPDQVRSDLGEVLPAYMVPSEVVVLGALPLTPSGKVDRNALPAAVPKPAPRPTLPSTEVEREVAALWCEVLRVDSVSLDDSFFGLGGHSLLAFRVVGRLARRLGVELPVSSLFDHPTLRDLAAEVAERRRTLVEEPWPEASLLGDLSPRQPSGTRGGADSISVSVDLPLDGGEALLNRDYVLAVSARHPSAAEIGLTGLEVLVMCDEHFQIMGEWSRELPLDRRTAEASRVVFVLRPVREGIGSVRIIFYSGGRWCGAQRLQVRCVAAGSFAMLPA